MSRDLSRRLRHDLLYAALWGAFKGLSFLPLGLLRPVGARLGGLSLRLSSKGRKRAEKHLEIAFPELDAAERTRIMRGCATHLGKNLAEVVWFSRASLADIRSLLTTDGLDRLHEFVENGQGVLMVTGHCGNWEMLNACMVAHGIPFSAVVREIFDPRLDKLGMGLRSRFGTEVIPRGFRAGHQVNSALNRGRVVVMVIDQDIGSIPSVFVPFFGRPAFTPIGAANFAIRAGCPFVPAFTHRQTDGRHHVQVDAPIEHPSPELDRDQRIYDLTAKASERIEVQIRRHPEQWVWTHRRWKTRPEDED